MSDYETALTESDGAYREEPPDAVIDAHLQLWEVIEAFEYVDWRHVPGVSVPEAATMQKRLREAEQRLANGDVAGGESR